MHLASGEVKDAHYLVKQIMPIMTKKDPENNFLIFDMVAFDVALNVQKAGKIIESRFPKVKVIEEMEHLGLIFLSNFLMNPASSSSRHSQ